MFRIYLDKPIVLGSLKASVFECESYVITQDKMFISFDTEIKVIKHVAHYYIPMSNVIGIESKVVNKEAIVNEFNKLFEK